MNSISPSALSALRAIDQYVHVTNDQLHTIAFPTRSLNWSRRQSAALVRKGLAESGRLPDRVTWFRATPRGQRCLGSPVRNHQDKGDQVRRADLAITQYCIAARPQLRRLRILEQQQFFPDIPTTKLKRPVCYDAHRKRLDLVFVRRDIEVAGIVRDCWKYTQTMRGFKSVQSLLRQERLRLVVITTTRHHARKLHDAMDRSHTWPLPRFVLWCPLLFPWEL